MSSRRSSSNSCELVSRSTKSEASRSVDPITIHEFYHELLKILSKEVANLQQNKLLSVEARLLAERCTHSLYLWAHGLDLQHFENTLPKETGLQSEVAQLLLDIARAVCTGSLSGLSHPHFQLNIAAFESLYNDVDELNTYDDAGTKDDDGSDVGDENQHSIITGPDAVPSQPHSQDDDRLSDHNSPLDIFKAIDLSIKDLMNLLPTIDSCCNEDNIPTVPCDSAAVVLHEERILSQADPYILQVKDKFPTIREELARRIGIANLDRWLRLRHQQPQNDGTLENDSASCLLSRSEFQDSGLGASLPTKSHYAVSNASHRSFISTDSAAARGAARVPKTPREVSEGLDFVCQFCDKIQKQIRNRIDWKRHVFADIRPYLCTFADCNKSQLTFSTRKQWSLHEFNEHRRRLVWRCAECKLDFSQPASLWNHKTSEHPEGRDKNKGYQTALLKHSQLSLPCDITREDCSFCQQSNFAAQKDFVNHVGRHMEEVALVAVPTDIDSDDQEDIEDPDSSRDGVPGNSEVSRGRNRVVPAFTKEQNAAINVRAAELARGSTREIMSRVLEQMKPDMREYLRQKGIDPTIYYFRMLATSEFRAMQAKHVEHIPAETLDAHDELETIVSDVNKRSIGERLTDHQAATLQNWYGLHMDKPYPNDDEALKLQEETQLTLLQIRSWFLEAQQRRSREICNYEAPERSDSWPSSSQDVAVEKHGPPDPVQASEEKERDSEVIQSTRACDSCIYQGLVCSGDQGVCYNCSTTGRTCDYIMYIRKMQMTGKVSSPRIN